MDFFLNAVLLGISLPFTVLLAADIKKRRTQWIFIDAVLVFLGCVAIFDLLRGLGVV